MLIQINLVVLDMFKASKELKDLLRTMVTTSLGLITTPVFEISSPLNFVGQNSPILS